MQCVRQSNAAPSRAGGRAGEWLGRPLTLACWLTSRLVGAIGCRVAVCIHVVSQASLSLSLSRRSTAAAGRCWVGVGGGERGRGRVGLVVAGNLGKGAEKGGQQLHIMDRGPPCPAPGRRPCYAATALRSTALHYATLHCTTQHCAALHTSMPAARPSATPAHAPAAMPLARRRCPPPQGAPASSSDAATRLMACFTLARRHA